MTTPPPTGGPQVNPGQPRHNPREATTSTEVSESAQTCAFAGCTRPVRERAGDGGGKPPKYCALLNEKTGKYAHTALTAAREQAKRERQASGDGGRNEPETGESPASAAQARAASLLEQFRAEVAKANSTLQLGLEALGEATDPESVGAELSAAKRTVRRVQLEADEAVTTAHTERDQALAEARHLREQLEEATGARDEAIAELETSEQAREAADHQAEQTRVELEQVTADRDAQRGRAEEAERAQAETAEQLKTAQAEANATGEQLEQVRAKLATSTQHVADLTEERNQLRGQLETEQGHTEEQRQRADTAAGQAEQLREQQQHAVGELATAREQLAKQQTASAELRAKATAAEQAAETERGYRAEQRETYEATVRDLRAEIERLRKQHSTDTRRR
ncbi:hypothetical protein [Saccharopolyspora hattusasensis]|uniref:hypothetical protein n=1 Tax=Saccharopolyspora hattusasensis TaxID=1128679 RepID=UPI003D992CF4